MKQTIEIEVPDGKKAVWKDNTIVFEDIKPQLPKTWEEFCEMRDFNKYEVYIEFNSQCVEIGEVPDGMKRNPYEDKNILPSEKAAKQHLALMQLHQLRDCYRQGWKPNWYVEDYKFCIKQDKYYVGDYTPKVQIFKYRPEFLSFQTIEIAEEFLNNFKDLIEQAGDLI